MTDTDGPFDSKQWSEAQWARFAATWAPSGVLGAPAASSTTGDLPLSVSGLSVGLGAGRAWVRGFGFERTGAAVMQAVTANTHASFSRRDRIVLRRNLATHTVTPVLLTGTPAGTPAAPVLTQSEAGSWDLPLFSFLVPPNSGTSITGLVDERVWVDPGGDGRRITSAAVAGWPADTYSATNNYDLGSLVIDPKIGPYVAHVQAAGFFVGSAGVDASLRLITPGPVIHNFGQLHPGKDSANPSKWIKSTSGASITVFANLEVLAGAVTAYADAAHSFLEATVFPL